MLTFAISGALAAVAAVLYAPINLVYPAMGNLVITKAFVIIILGGMGSVPGAIVGGLIIGFAESFGAFYISTDYKDIIAFVLLVVILSFRPQGLFRQGSPLMKFLKASRAGCCCWRWAWPSLPREERLPPDGDVDAAYIYAIATIGLNLITGYTGQFNLAHSGFMAVGAYTVGILTVDHQVPFWIAFAAGGRDCRRARLLRRPGVAAPEGPLLLDLHAVRGLHHVPADREVGKPHARHRWASSASRRRRASGRISSTRRARSTTWCCSSWCWAVGHAPHRALAAGPHLHGDPQRRRPGRGAGHQPDAQQAAGLHAVGVLRRVRGRPVCRLRALPRPGLASVEHTFDMTMYMLVGGIGTLLGPLLGAIRRALAHAVPAVPAGLPLRGVRPAAGDRW
jgi:hypothetical protein